MKDSTNTADITMYIKSEIKDTNDEKNDGNQASNDKNLEPSMEDVSVPNNISVKEEFPKPIVKSEIDSEDTIDEKKVFKQENNAENQDFKSDDVNKDPVDGSDSVKNKIEIVDPLTDPCEVKHETIVQEEKSGSSKNINKLYKRKRPKNRPRPSKRARITAKQVADTMVLTKDVEAENVTSNETSSNDMEYCLTVTNLPNSWSFMDIKNYIDMQCGPVDEIEMLKHDKTGNGAIRLSYHTKDECDQAMKKLDGKEIEGTKLTVSMSVEILSDSENAVETPSTPGPGTSNAQEDTALSKPWRPDLDMWEIDPKGTYGLKESFLKTLSIAPPLDKWVHVSNFRCDKTDLRDVLEMAGNVVMCSVFNTPLKYATVMYSHPLEAVQAVSMLNDQNFYGQRLKVVMERSPVNTVLLAKGLTEVGIGLGANGKPLRNITKHYQRYVTNQSASLNLNAFVNVTTNGNLVVDEEFQVKKVEDFSYVVPKSDKTANTETEGKSHVDSPKKSPEPIIESNSNAPKFNATKVQTPARSPMRQQGPSNFQPRNGPNFGPFGSRPGPVWSTGPDPPMQRPFGPRPGPRPGWNGPGSMGPMSGPMPGPRPMGPMQGPMHRHMQRPMQGAMQRPMQGTMQGPMQGTMQGPMQGSMQGTMQGSMQGTMQGPMQGPMQGAMQGSMQGTMQGSMQGTMHGSMQGTMQGQMQGAMQGPMQGATQGSMNGSMQGPMQMTGLMQVSGYNPNQPVQLHLSNLPPSTTFALLCEKMAACGQVVSIQLATPGSAVVTFANRIQADQCFQSYHNACVEGCVIQVKYT